MASSRILTSTKLVKSVRDRAMVPDDRSTYTDEVILDILNEEIDVSLLSTLMSLNEEHLVTHIDIPVSETQSRYKIPERSIGNKLRDVALIRGDQMYELTRISLEEAPDYEGLYNGDNLNVFYIEGDEVVFFSGVDASYIRMYFYMRPNLLVKQEECGEIFSIDRNTGIIELSNFPTSFSNLPEIDFVQGKTPNKVLQIDIETTLASKTSSYIQVNPDIIPDDLQKGDYVCSAGETPVPNIPTEMHPLLAQYAAIFILEGLNDSEGLRNARTKLEKMENSIQTLLEDRVEGAPQKINPRHSTLVQTGLRNRVFRR